MNSSTTVIVVSYRPGSWLRSCLESIVGQADEVVLVDNGSAGEEASLVGRELGVRVVRSSTNVGFAGGVQLGVAQASGDLVGLINDDAVAGPNWLSAAAAVLADPSVAAVTPKVLLAGWFAEIAAPQQRLNTVQVGGRQALDELVGAGIQISRRGEAGGTGDTCTWATGRRPFYVPVTGPDSTEPVLINCEQLAAGPIVRIVNHAGSFLRAYGAAGEYGRGAPDDGRFDARQERFGFSGTAPVFRAETLKRIGGFAPEFFAYNEDTDWCMRARLAGMRVVYDPAATVTHRLSATSGGPEAPMVRFLHERNAQLCLLRNAPAKIAGRNFLGRLARHARDPVSRATISLLPWAISTRLEARKSWVVSPREVWNAWAERDLHWDDGPARPP